MEAFVGKVLTDTSGFTTTLLAGIGDRLGLRKDLAARGPATIAELGERAGISERYAREWLSALTASGYLDHDGTTGSPDNRRSRSGEPPDNAVVGTLWRRP